MNKHRPAALVFAALFALHLLIFAGALWARRPPVWLVLAALAAPVAVLAALDAVWASFFAAAALLAAAVLLVLASSRAASAFFALA